MNRNRWIAAVVGLFCIMMVTMADSCSGNNSSAPTAQDKAQQASNNLQDQVYQSKHNIEFRNYNLRQKVADDPSTILWCTFFPPGVQGVSNGSTPGQAITVPIAGKLTSSNKRPYAGERWTDRGNYAFTSNDAPGPDHMYGSSSEYSYGFDPTLTTYYQFSNLASFCTTEPTVWQVHNTDIVVNTQSTLANLSGAASAAIKAGNPKKALELLQQADTAAATVNAK